VSAVTFDELIDFVQNRMSMSHVYQPLVIRALADADGAATLRQLAVALVTQDEAVLAEAEVTLKQMPLRVLDKHHVVSYDSKCSHHSPRLALPYCSWASQAKACLRWAVERKCRTGSLPGPLPGV
jgi:hypothetical protein